ncbi:hypothetical protein [uncultured Bacteroides sp.]|uniref:hypothetical protein n=1 Tax=uncultured Bacteroides sp. TaxID=162156 RepID=UPI00261CAC74|nr:hypothetical protein [uncultured Bacteroides sp.]
MPNVARYEARIQNEEGKFVLCTDDSGNVIRFVSFINAINYYSSKGWEIVKIFTPKEATDVVQVAIIRKLMPKDEILKFANPVTEEKTDSVSTATN